MGKISDPEDGKALQNFMICCEMAIAGIALLYAFPHKEYQIGGSTSGWRWESFRHAISIHDVVKDAIHVVSMTDCAGTPLAQSTVLPSCDSGSYTGPTVGAVLQALPSQPTMAASSSATPCGPSASRMWPQLKMSWKH
jgi:hypothetical protein